MDAQDDFEDFVRARLRDLWGSSVLVADDPQAALEALRAGVVDLADRWGTDRADRPDLTLQGGVLRGAAATDASARPTVLAGAVEPDVEQERATRAALATLTPQQRAALLLTALGDHDPEQVDAALHLRRGTTAGEARIGLRAVGTGEGETRARLEALAAWAEEVWPAPDETDLAREAWQQTRSRHSRRRAIGLGGAAVVALAGGAAAFVATREEPDTGPPPDRTAPAPSSAGVGPQTTSVEAQGLTIDLAPDVAALDRLPVWPQRHRLRLPPRLGFAADADLPRLSPRSDPVCAVLLRAVRRAQEWRPVLLLGDGRLVEVALPLRRTTSDDPPVGPTAISDDAHRVVLPVDLGVALVDVRAGTVRRLEVPDPSIASVGWTAGSRYVVVRGASAWRVDPRDGSALRAFASDAGHAILVARTGVATVIVNGERGISEQLKAVSRAVTDVAGEPVSDAVPQVADAVRFDPVAQQATGRAEGVYAVDVPTMRERGLAAEPLGIPAPPLRPKGWAGPGTLLVSALGQRGQDLTDRLLVWETVSGRLWRAAEVGPVSVEVGAFSGQYVLGPRLIR